MSEDDRQPLNDVDCCIFFQASNRQILYKQHKLVSKQPSILTHHPCWEPSNSSATSLRSLRTLPDNSLWMTRKKAFNLACIATFQRVDLWHERKTEELEGHERERSCHLRIRRGFHQLRSKNSSTINICFPHRGNVPSTYRYFILKEPQVRLKACMSLALSGTWLLFPGNLKQA